MQLAVILAICGAGLLVSGCDRQPDTQPDQRTQAAAKGLDRSRSGAALPDLEIRDSDDEPASLADAAGKPMLVNIWATWCAPCVKELPTLNALSRSADAPRVIAVSQDMAPRASVDAFLAQLGVEELEAWHDPQMALSGRLGAHVLPTTIYYDAKGRELWRFVGDLDWTGDEAARLLAEGREKAGSS